MPTGHTWPISGALRQSLANSNRNTVCNTHTYNNTPAYGYTNGNTDRYCYSDGYGNTHNYSTANADAEECSDAERASDSATEAVMPGIGESAKRQSPRRFVLPCYQRLRR
jgi:hypothetical protein